MKLPLRGHLWGNRDFRRFWFGQAINSVGTQVTGLALPTVAILNLRAGSVQIGILRALQSLSFLLLSLVFGVWLDRARRRRVLLATDLGQAVILASIPAAFLWHLLTLQQLYAVALISGILTVAFDIGYETYVPELVEPGDLVEGFTSLQVSAASASVAGPTLGGLLIQVLGAPLAILADIISYLVSVAALLSIRQDGSRPRSASLGVGQVLGEIRDGLRITFRSPIIRTLSACAATANFGSGILGAVFLLFLYGELHLTPAQIGVIFGISGVAGIVGAIGASSVIRALGLGRVLTLVLIFEGLAILLLPVARYGAAIGVVTGVTLVHKLTEPIWRVGVGSLRQAVIPDRLRGRITGTTRTIVFGVAPFAAITGGILGTTIGITASVLVAGLFMVASSIWLVTGPVVRLKEQPSGPESIFNGL